MVRRKSEDTFAVNRRGPEPSGFRCVKDLPCIVSIYRQCFLSFPSVLVTALNRFRSIFQPRPSLDFKPEYRCFCPFR